MLWETLDESPDKALTPLFTREVIQVFPLLFSLLATAFVEMHIGKAFIIRPEAEQTAFIHLQRKNILHNESNSALHQDF